MDLQNILLFTVFGIIIIGLPLALFWKSQQKNILQNGGIIAVSLFMFSLMSASVITFQEAIVLKNQGTTTMLTYNGDAEYRDKRYHFSVSGKCGEHSAYDKLSESFRPEKNTTYEYYCFKKDNKILLQKRWSVEHPILQFIFTNIILIIFFGFILVMIYTWKQYDKYVKKHGQEKPIKITDLLLNKF